MTVSAPPARSTASEFPIRLGPPDAFRTLQSLFDAAAFDETTVATRLGGWTLVGVPRLVDGRKTLGGAVEDANAALVRLFVDQEPLSADLLQRLFGREAVAAFEALGLLAPASHAESSLAATVMLTPTGGLWLASDLRPNTDNSDGALQDFVFSASNELTAQFLAVIPDAPGARVIELCAGTGVAALRAAKGGAREAWAADLAPRCVHFARFNAHINGIADRVTVVESDGWDSLAGETFDLVVAHPPYVPARVHRFDFRDAGEDGEQVARRIVAGLGEHLRPGGRCVLRAGVTERREAPGATRVAQWLGASAGEFDLVVLESASFSPMDVYRSAGRGGKEYRDCERWLRRFDEVLQIERFAICLLEFRRDVVDRAPVIERRTLGSSLDHGAFDWTFCWAKFLAGAGDTASVRLAGLRPRVPPGVRLAVRLESDATGNWTAVGAVVETDWPTRTIVNAPALAPTLLELCDGTRDVPALLDGLRQAGLVGDDVGLGEVAHLVEVLAAAGALELTVCPIPARPRPVSQPGAEPLGIGARDAAGAPNEGPGTESGSR